MRQIKRVLTVCLLLLTGVVYSQKIGQDKPFRTVFADSIKARQSDLKLIHSTVEVVGDLEISGELTLSTDLAITEGGTGASTASGARTNLGLGTIATQNANAVAITGGTITDLSSLNFGSNMTITGASGDLVISPNDALRFGTTGVVLGTSSVASTGREISVEGSESNISLLISPKGTGTVYTSSGHTTNISGANDVITKGYADENYGGDISGSSGSIDDAIITANGTGGSTVQGATMRLIGAGSIRAFVPNTSDGGDNLNVFIGSGGAQNSTRGATLQLIGNEAAGDDGDFKMFAGNVDGDIKFYTSPSAFDYLRLTITPQGYFTMANATTVPAASESNAIILYAQDVSSSSELKVRDEAGNITTLSPHNFSHIPGGQSEEMAWSFYSERDGKYINVDMLRLVRLLEALTGEKLVYIGER